MGSPRERMLRLLSLLQSGRQWPAPELARACECTPRTLRRDIEFLRDLGYPVRSTRGPGGHYQLAAGRALPPLMLEDDEAIAAMLGLRLAAAADSGSGADSGGNAEAAAGSTPPAGLRPGGARAAERAAAKLRRVLPPRLRETTDEMLAALEVATTSQAMPDPALLQPLTRAVTEHTTVRFDYAGTRGTTRRTVEPARLVRLQQHWYLFAWDRERADWRTFRLDRITDGPLQVGTRFTPRDLPADDLAEYLRERFRGVPEITVRLTIHAGLAEAASRLYRVDGTLEAVDEDRCRYTAHVDSYEWLAVVLALSKIDFAVEEPDDFRRYLAALANRLTRATSEP